MTPIEQIREIRAKLGFGLREAADALKKYGSAAAAIEALARWETRQAHDAEQDALVSLRKRERALWLVAYDLQMAVANPYRQGVATPEHSPELREAVHKMLEDKITAKLREMKP